MFKNTPESALMMHLRNNGAPIGASRQLKKRHFVKAPTEPSKTRILTIGSGYSALLGIVIAIRSVTEAQ
jgi:hypothetical protein